MHYLLKTMRIFAWSRYLQKLVPVGAIRRFIFNFLANQNFSQHRKVELLRKWIALVLQTKFRYMGCLVKTNALVLGNITLPLSSQLIVLVFKKQPSAERYLANIFSPVFLWTLWNVSDEYSLLGNTNLRSTVQVYHFFFGSINFQCMFSLVYTVYCQKQPSE